MARILLFEDDEWLRRAVAIVLKREGHEVSIVPDAESGSRAIEQSQPDVVVLDADSASLNAAQIFSDLRRVSFANPILALVPDEKKASELMINGASMTMVKPFGIDELSARVRTCLNQVKN